MKIWSIALCWMGARLTAGNFTTEHTIDVQSIAWAIQFAAIVVAFMAGREYDKEG